MLSLPIIKEIVGWIRNHEMIEYLKGQVLERDKIITAKDKELAKLYRRVKKAEKL